ncbi:TRAP transporter small permease [Sagittula sp. SSi028]|uniref:TRAP transporter small permease n=1 Tax=Sagittula sp. SSi028 TaxID=3400636 RepID=UPI003AF71A31
MTVAYRMVDILARAAAWIGGAVLAGLIVLTCLSILGREINAVLHSLRDTGFAPQLMQSLIDTGIGAVRGDYELVEAGMAFCIFAFLPLCTLTKGHASVDILARALPQRINRGLELVVAVLMAVVLVIIALQLEQGLARKLKSGQTTTLLELPIWWAYAACLAGAVLTAVAACVNAVIAGMELITGRAFVRAPQQVRI